VSFDSSEASLAAIETGELAAVVAHDPYQCGYQAVDRLVMYHRSDALGRPASGRGCINVPAQLVERGTLAEYRSGLKIDGSQAR
jgi:ABC-type sugar transport system substrate-binding protein